MYLILLSVFVPILMGILLLVRKEYADRRRLLAVTGVGFALTRIKPVYTMKKLPSMK